LRPDTARSFLLDEAAFFAVAFFAVAFFVVAFFAVAFFAVFFVVVFFAEAFFAEAFCDGVDRFDLGLLAAFLAVAFALAITFPPHK